jgi:hypothetical protein
MKGRITISQEVRMKHESKAATIGRRWFEEVWSQRRDDLVEELMTADSIGP